MRATLKSFLSLFYSATALTNGRCTVPGECICNNGYTGSDCTQPIAATTTSFSITSSATATTKHIPSNTNIASSTLTPSPSPNAQSDQSNVVTIAGGAAAGVVILLIFVFVIIVVSYCVIKSKNRGIEIYDITFVYYLILLFRENERSRKKRNA